MNCQILLHRECASGFVVRSVSQWRPSVRRKVDKSRWAVWPARQEQLPDVVSGLEVTVGGKERFVRGAGDWPADRSGECARNLAARRARENAVEIPRQR